MRMKSFNFKLRDKNVDSKFSTLMKPSIILPWFKSDKGNYILKTKTKYCKMKELKKEETGPGSQALFLVGVTTLTQIFHYIVDIKIGNITNVESFDVYINGDYYGADVQIIQITTNDTLRIDVTKTDNTQEGNILFENKLV